jgi:PKD repeat protein
MNKTKGIYCLLAIIIFFLGCGKEENDDGKPVAKFTPSGYNLPVPCTINFVNNSSNATSFFWSLGDGTTTTNANPSKTYTAIGTYFVTLKVNGPKGSDSICRSITLDQVLPNETTFSYYMDKCSGTPVSVQFYSLNPQSLFHAWDFGNGLTSPEANPIIRYETAGNYTIKFSTQIGGRRDTVIRAIQIN